MGSQRSTIGNAIGSLPTASGEDRSDTWSVDAVASDSEADPIQRNDDLLMIDDPDNADVSSGLPASVGYFLHRLYRSDFHKNCTYSSIPLMHLNISVPSGNANAILLASVCSESNMVGGGNLAIQGTLGGHTQNEASRGNSFSFQHVAKYCIFYMHFYR